MLKRHEAFWNRRQTEAATCDVEGTFAGWQRIQQHKPLVIWRAYADDFPCWLARVLREFSPRGLAIQISVRDAAEAEKVKEEMLKHDIH